MEINHGGGTARGLVLLIGGAPGGKRRQPVRPEAALGLLATLPPESLLGSPIPASVLQLADPADPQLLLAQLQTASVTPGPVLVALVGQLTADRRRKELHLALARTSRENTRYTALPWAWLGDQLRQRPSGTTTVLADLVADPEAWAVLQQQGPEALTTGLPLLGQVSPPGTIGDGYAPPYTRALVDQLRRAQPGTRPADLHHLAAHSGLPAGALLLTPEAPTAGPAPATAGVARFELPPAPAHPGTPAAVQARAFAPGPAAGAGEPAAGTTAPTVPAPGALAAPAAELVGPVGVTPSLPTAVPAVPAPATTEAGAAIPAGTTLPPAPGPVAPTAAPPAVPVPAPEWASAAPPVPTQPVAAVVPAVVVPPADTGTMALRQAQPVPPHPPTMPLRVPPIPAPAAPAPVPVPAGAAGEQHDRAGTVVPAGREVVDPRPAIAAALHGGDLARAAYLIADWERQLLRHQGPRAPQLADVAEAQAQLALAGGELGRATERLIEAARLRTQSLPPQSPELATAVDNAVAIWGRLPRETALQHSAALLMLCRALPAGGGRLHDVEARLAQLSERTGLLRRAR